MLNFAPSWLGPIVMHRMGWKGPTNSFSSQSRSIVVCCKHFFLLETSRGFVHNSFFRDRSSLNCIYQMFGLNLHVGFCIHLIFTRLSAITVLLSSKRNHASHVNFNSIDGLNLSSLVWKLCGFQIVLLSRTRHFFVVGWKHACQANF